MLWLCVSCCVFVFDYSIYLRYSTKRGCDDEAWWPGVHYRLMGSQIEEAACFCAVLQADWNERASQLKFQTDPRTTSIFSPKLKTSRIIGCDRRWVVFICIFMSIYKFNIEGTEWNGRRHRLTAYLERAGARQMKMRHAKFGFHSVLRSTYQ